MTTFHIQNFGCRATQADAAAIECQLRARGLAPARPEQAELVIVNTCTVTSDADAVARQSIRAVHRANPAARIVVTGCYAQRAPEELAALPGVTHVIGNTHKSVIADLFAPQPSADSPARAGALPGDALVQIQLPSSRTSSLPRILRSDSFDHCEFLSAPVRGDEGDHTRPVLKVQDGCDYRCSYCVIPSVRGPSRSFEPARVVTEVNRLCAAGYHEVVLSGISLGSYGRDLAPRQSLLQLVRRILDETPLRRLRLSSIEPQDITRDLVELAISSGRLARHFHIPLQSGSDRVLAAMHRWYRAEHYARRVEMISELIPGAAIGADVIAGFPGETEDDHRETCALIARLPFAYLHVFAYSARPGTPAASLYGALPPRVIKLRSHELRQLATEKHAAFLRAQAGQVLDVLTLGQRKQGATVALTDNYLKVLVPGLHPRNRMLRVQLQLESGRLVGHPLPALDATPQAAVR